MRGQPTPASPILTPMHVEFAATVPSADRSPIRALLAKCDPYVVGQSVLIAPLVGGANNRNYTATSATTRCVVRIVNEGADWVGVDRFTAVRAQRQAATTGLAPVVLAVVLPPGHMVSQFLEGRPVDQQLLTRPDVLSAIGEAFHRLHFTAASLPSFSPFDDIRRWTALASDSPEDLPADLLTFLSACVRVEHLVSRLRLPQVFCHNDTVPQNLFYGSDHNVRFVDWDCAARGWASFEIASFLATSGLDEERSEIVLKAYGAPATRAQTAVLELWRFVAAVRELAWALAARSRLKGTTSTGDAWYDNYLDEHLHLARRLSAEHGFATLFDHASTKADHLW